MEWCVRCKENRRLRLMSNTHKFRWRSCMQLHPSSTVLNPNIHRFSLCHWKLHFDARNVRDSDHSCSEQILGDLEGWQKLYSRTNTHAQCNGPFYDRSQCTVCSEGDVWFHQWRVSKQAPEQVYQSFVGSVIVQTSVKERNDDPAPLYWVKCLQALGIDMGYPLTV